MSSENKQDVSRRKFLKTAGKFAVYTPPALMMMSSPSLRAISMSNNGCGMASGDVPAPGGSYDSNNAQNAMGGQNCPETSQGKTF